MNVYARSLTITALLALLAGCTTNHTTYRGTCSGNCVNGNGTLTHTGSQYTGTFALGVMQGPFDVRTSTGDTLTGNMVNGHFNGPVSIRSASGQQFVQTYTNGVPAQGTSIRSNGDVYEGTFQMQMVMAPASTIDRYGRPIYELQPVSLFHRGRYTTSTGEQYSGNFSLADTRLVFEGTKTRQGQRAVTGLHAAPFTPGTRDGFTFEPVKKEEVSNWKAAGESRVRSVLSAAQQTPGPGQVATVASALASANTTASIAPASAPSSASPSVNMIEGNTGRYLSPYTSDGVAAAWVEKSVNASLGASIGGMAGAYAGQKALEQVPFVGGFLGNKLGAEAGRKIALNAVGGEAYMRETSDISFNDINEMARWLVQNHSSHAKFKEIMKAAGQIYPELNQAYMVALRRR